MVLGHKLINACSRSTDGLDPIKELLRPKSLNDWWAMNIDQRIERGEEFDEEGAHDFNLSDPNKNTVEVK